ncbi:hypothetical protein [uncultured Chitinophaga sp.]|jgi:hypothetical protein|uniref:hypothetical protein n=1 Tax=uncultured Chitinophaga sp. TaxID=339340 RepID=UPI002622170C|nr:hypothetical protein [uncultured Chitinophaga sp.]
MRLRFLLLACVTITAFSCKKSNEQAPPAAPPASEGTVEALLKLTGDIKTSESPLGKKAPGTTVFAKTLTDSTIYYVIVRKDNKSVYIGVFNQADSIKLKLPTAGTVTVEAAAYKKGSGTGLFYRWYDGRQAYSSPIYGGDAVNPTGYVTNQMDTIRYVYGYVFRADSLRYRSMFVPEDSTRATNTLHPEMDAYLGSTTFAASAAPDVVNLFMKRHTFGVQYSTQNFTSGRLIADYSNYMPTRYLTPADTTRQFLYTAEEFKERDSLLNDAVTVKLKWEKPDGAIVALGEKKIYFKRNILTKINVTIPPSGSAAFTPSITETDWTGSETVGF